jgi:hypothetical protein
MNTPRTDSPSYLDHHYDMGDYFRAPKRKVLHNDRSHHRSSSSSTSVSIDFMNPATLSPYASPKKTIASFNFNTPTTNLSPCSSPKKTTKRNREGEEETTPLRLQLPTLLSPATEDRLLSSPGLAEAFAALGEEFKYIDSASVAMLEEESSSDRNNIRLRRVQANTSPLPPSPANFPHPLTQNLVSPENLSPIILNRKEAPPGCPRTPPLKKRHLAATNHPNQYHHQEQQQKQRNKNKRISLTVPNLLMGLKYPTSTKQQKHQQKQQQQQQQIEGRNVKTKRGEIFPLHQEFLTTKKRKKNSEMNDFPLPSLKKQEGGKDINGTDKTKKMKNGTTTMMMATYNNNNNIIGKKAPSLETFRRKWDSLSKRKGHISEHRMSIAEQKQLLRDSFSKTMIRPPTNNRRNHY